MALGRTWAGATLAWAGDTSTWDLGTGSSADSGVISLGEASSVLVLRAPSDVGTLTAVEFVDLLVSFPTADVGTLALAEAAQITVLVAPSDDGFVVGIVDRFEVLIDDWPQVDPAAPTTWDKDDAVSGIWTKQSPTTLSGWN